MEWPFGKVTWTGLILYNELKKEILQHICSLAPESMSQWVDFCCKDEGRENDIPTKLASLARMLKETKGITIMWLEVAIDKVDAGATKFACCNKDTSWAYWSWERPVLELVELSKL